MSHVRVLVGTRKGAFILTADGKREEWEVACSNDISRESLDVVLPEEVMSGREPFLIIGAISGG